MAETNQAPTRAAPQPDLPGLLARVQAARGRDRPLDALLACNVDPKLAGEWEPHPDFASGDVIRDASGCMRGPERYTSSLDAALALAERALPGSRVKLSIFGHGEERAELKPPHDIAQNDFGATPALAILTVLLRAIIARGRADG
jgi:hypothetical protein